MADQDKTQRVELTEEQKKQLDPTQHEDAGTDELTIEELEERIAPVKFV